MVTPLPPLPPTGQPIERGHRGHRGHFRGYSRWHRGQLGPGPKMGFEEEYIVIECRRKVATVATVAAEPDVS